MARERLKPEILDFLKKKTKGKISEQAIKVALSRIREKNPSLTLNAAAEVFAKRRGFSVGRYLEDRDREALRGTVMMSIKVPTPRYSKERIVEIARYETDDKLLQMHLKEINKAYTTGCYTATFVLCRKVLENLIIHHILKRKYPLNKKEHKEKYFDFSRGRFLDFSKLLENLRKSSGDFGTEKKLVERICQLCQGFKETADEMTHSLYHIATKREIDDKNFQYILDLISKLEKTF
ncbi:MAG: hypothetical protein QW228_08810 [Candidatus Aenigmatarchaeota archaeon]